MHRARWLAVVGLNASRHAALLRLIVGLDLQLHLFDSPARWPSIWGWIAASRQNALALFPEEAYHRLRIDRAVFGRRLVLLSDPDAIDHVCGKGSDRYRLSNLHLRLLRPSLGDGLTVAQGRRWAVQRRLAIRMMPRAVDEERAAGIERRIEATVSQWSAALHGPVDGARLADTLVALSIDLIAQSVFGHGRPVASRAVVDAVNTHRAITERADLLDAFGVDPRIPSPRMAAASRIAHSLDGDIEQAMREAADRHGMSASGPSEAARPELTRDFVVSLITGFESVTATTLWMLLVCAYDPELQARLRDGLAPDDGCQVVPARGAPRSFLDACLAETLRLYPPLPLIFRTAVVDDPGIGETIRKGSIVCISPWVVHRHRALWDEPEKFDPGRHLRGDAEPRGFLPFGVGARRCVGMHVGNHLVKRIVTQVLQRFEVRGCGAERPQPRAGLSLRPGSAFDLRFQPLR